MMLVVRVHKVLFWVGLAALCVACLSLCDMSLLTWIGTLTSISAAAFCIAVQSKQPKPGRDKGSQKQQPHQLDQPLSNSLSRVECDIHTIHGPSSTSCSEGSHRSSDALAVLLASNTTGSITSKGSRLSRGFKDGRLVYQSQLIRSKVTFKIRDNESSIKPEHLLDTAIPDLCSQVQSRITGSLVCNVAVRRGCIAISFDVCYLLPLESEDSEGHAGMHQHHAEVEEVLRSVAVDWAQKFGAVGQLQHKTSITVQVGNSVLRCMWDAGEQAWEMEAPQEMDELGLFGIKVSSPALLLSPPSDHQTQHMQYAQHTPQHAQQLVGQAWEQQGPATQIVFPLVVHTPASLRQLVIAGWQGGGESQLQLLARVRGRFLAVDVQRVEGDKEQLSSLTHAHTLQVRVCIPPEVAHSKACSRLELELLYNGYIASSKCLLLAPGHLAGLTHELQTLASSQDDAQARGYTNDLTDWLQLQGIARAAALYTEACEGRVRGLRQDSAMEDSLGESTVARRRVSASVLAALCSQGGFGGSEAAVVSEAARPEAMHTLVQGGQEMLQFSIAQGLPATAQQLLQGLLGPPCNLSFRSLAAGLEALPNSIPSPTSIAASRPGNLECAASVSFLGLALMSGNPSMVATVLEWGHHHAGPGFSWCRLDDGTGSAADDGNEKGLREQKDLWTALGGPVAGEGEGLGGLELEGRGEGGTGVGEQGLDESVLSLLQVLPENNPCLQLLLSDPVEGPIVSGARAGTSITSLAAPSPAAAAAAGAGARAHPTNTAPTAASAGMEAIAGSSCSASSKPPQPSQVLPRKVQSHLWRSFYATFQGFGEVPDGLEAPGTATEREFRAWCFASNRRWASGCCWTILSCVAVAIIKAITHDRVASDLPVLMLYGLPYVFVLNANMRAPNRRQQHMRTAKFCRLLSMGLMGLRVVPVPVAICSLVEKHLEFITDLMIHRVMDQVQLKALLLDRVVSTTAFFSLYSALNIHRPLYRSLGLNMTSLIVGLLLDMRNRVAYLHNKARHAKRE